MTALPFMTTEELEFSLRSHRDSLRRLQEYEPIWRKDDRKRGLAAIAEIRALIETTETELMMAKAA